MKHYKDAIIHGAQLFRQLQGHQTSNNELSTAKISLAASGMAARALNQQRNAAGGEDEPFSFSFGSGGAFGGGEGDDDESGDGFDFLSAFEGFGGGGGGDDESGDGFDFLSAFGGFGGGGEDDDESGGGGLDFFSSAFGGMGGMGMAAGEDDDMGEMLEQCGVDVSDMATKALGAFFMSGAEMDFSSPESYEAVAPILLALKDDDEVNCEGTEMAQVMLAFEEYLKCSGMNDFFDPMNFEDAETLALIQSIESVCQPVFDMLISGDLFELEEEDILNEESEIAKSIKPCAQTLLGDNSFGNLIRYQYDNLDKTFSCFSNLSEDLPHCVISTPSTDESTAVSFPLSLEKKMACVLGSSYDPFLNEACTDTYDSLDKCLPQADATNVDEVTAKCAEEEGLMLGKLDFFGMDASVLSSNKMPAFCYRIFEEKNMDITDVQSRLDNFNKHREYGWTLESIASKATPEVEAMEKPEQAYTSNPIDIQSVESLEWEDGEAASTETDSGSGQAKFFPFLIVVLAIVAAVAVAFLVKHARIKIGGTRSQSTPKTNSSRKEYAHVAVKAMDLA